MQVLQGIQQGSKEWLAIRAKHHTASEAPVAMGASRYQTRDQLLHQKHTGIAQEVDSHTQALFDRGHATEAAARILLEQDLADDLYPVTALDDAGHLLASFDGINLMGNTGFEHKLWSERLAKQVRAGELEPHYFWQLEQQILVGGLEKVIFVTSDGTRENWAQMEYRPAPGRAEQLLAGWAQFDIDLAAYVAPEAKAAPVVAAPMETLPAVSVRVDGQLAIISNLPAFGEALRAFIARIPDSPKTDQEFADTEAACKSLKQAEDALAASESNALAQLEDVDTMRRLVADCRNLARTTRLQKEKLVTAQKELLRGEAVAGGVTALRQHIAELHAGVGKPWVQVPQANFGAVIKGMRSLDSIRGAINDELARCKIEADAQARRIVANIRVLDQVGHAFLFSDAQQLAVGQDPEAFAALVKGRIFQHQAAEQKHQDAQRERIRAEELAKLQREADAENAKLRADIIEAEQTAKAAIDEARAAEALPNELLDKLGNLATALRSDAVSCIDAERVIANAQRAEPADTGERRRQDQHAAAQAAQRAAEQAEATERAAAVIAQAECPTNDALEHAHHDALTTGCGLVRMHSTGEAEHIAPEQFRDTGERINLSAINEHLAPISINAAGLAALGFEPVAVVKASKLYRSEDLRHIRAALVRHLQGLALQAA